MEAIIPHNYTLLYEDIFLLKTLESMQLSYDVQESMGRVTIIVKAVDDLGQAQNLEFIQVDEVDGQSKEDETYFVVYHQSVSLFNNFLAKLRKKYDELHSKGLIHLFADDPEVMRREEVISYRKKQAKRQIKNLKRRKKKLNEKQESLLKKKKELYVQRSILVDEAEKLEQEIDSKTKQALQEKQKEFEQQIAMFNQKEEEITNLIEQKVNESLPSALESSSTIRRIEQKKKLIAEQMKVLEEYFSKRLKILEDELEMLINERELLEVKEESINSQEQILSDEMSRKINLGRQELEKCIDEQLAEDEESLKQMEHRTNEIKEKIRFMQDEMRIGVDYKVRQEFKILNIRERELDRESKCLKELEEKINQELQKNPEIKQQLIIELAKENSKNNNNKKQK
ncbi:MAG: hypothetical protein RML72_02970 [Bacteroidia bacterium]|nr:hypothetical protein [Bacteroidia bacterium]MDW8157823.1 hypothetical protein [Bacteroidia bacterium]